MPNYQNGKIYKLWSPQGEENEVYYGSTTLDLGKRKTQHKNQHKTSIYKCTSKILFEKYDDVRIELVEKCSCNEKEELNKREGHYIRNYLCLNKVIPDRTHKEYDEYNKEYHKEYYENNKEKLTEQRKEYLENNKEKIAEKKKVYYENNKEAILEQQKEKSKNYYENNKEKIKERMKKKVTCDCGCIIGNSDLAKHKKTNKHLLLMKHLE